MIKTIHLYHIICWFIFCQSNKQSNCKTVQTLTCFQKVASSNIHSLTHSLTVSLSAHQWPWDGITVSSSNTLNRDQSLSSPAVLLKGGCCVLVFTLRLINWPWHSDQQRVTVWQRNMSLTWIPGLQKLSLQTFKLNMKIIQDSWQVTYF